MNSVIRRLATRLITTATNAVDGLVFTKEELNAELSHYDQILSNSIAYYNELNKPEKERFLQRVYQFMKSKKFHYTGLERDKNIEVLISACAVQITFGLRKFKMPFFKNIYVLADQYTMGLNSQNWVGHVNRLGIYLSWKHFLYGYASNNDRYNVGLHEMAHALVYVNFLGVLTADGDFKEQFMVYKKKAEALAPHENFKQLFSEHACASYHECWAEGVELFFENPVDLHQHYPELYELIKTLLNQDPVNKIKILKVA